MTMVSDLRIDAFNFGREKQIFDDIARHEADDIVRHEDDLSRYIRLAGCFNFRDVGGYPCQRNGQKTYVAWRQLFRSDGLSYLTRADVEVLSSLGLRTVIDLRTSFEVQRNGIVANIGTPLHYEHLPLVIEVPRIEELAAWSDPQTVGQQYLQMLDEGMERVIRVLEIISDPWLTPAVIHCSAGKDRTGVVIAVILGLLGVPDNLIVYDYKLSHEPMNQLMRSILCDGDGRDILDGLPAAIFSAEPEAMSSFLSLFRSRHGSFEAFAKTFGLTGLAERIGDLYLV